jgi:hypothetical protein
MESEVLRVKRDYEISIKKITEDHKFNEEYIKKITEDYELRLLE